MNQGVSKNDQSLRKMSASALLKEMQLNPQIVDHEGFPFDKFKYYRWPSLLNATPDVMKNNKAAWVLLLSQNRKCRFKLPAGITIDECPFKDFTQTDWGKIVENVPNWVSSEHFNSDCLESMDWAKVVVHHPTFYKVCPMEKLSSEALVYLIHSKFYRSPHWEYIRTEEEICENKRINEVIDNNHPNRVLFQYLYSPWYSSILLRPHEWADHFRTPSMLARKKAIMEATTRNDFPWEKLDIIDWEKVIIVVAKSEAKMSSIRRSQISEHLLGEKSKCPWDKLYGLDWGVLEAKLPWEKLPGAAWVQRVLFHPIDTSKCPWDRLLGVDWTVLFIDFPEITNQPEVMKYFDWEILNGWQWSCLLCYQPQFADKCDWSKLDGWDIVNLLVNCPQFADRCDWSKLDGKNIVNLLEYSFLEDEDRSQFADKCDWSKLDGKNIVNLLKYWPQFADKCDLTKISQDDWRRLCDWHPELEKHACGK
ncbi:MAG: hypothetical protein IKO40_05905 [Kiritimatiellae bacterium]|nr:hypothetical protein [Kiritimatiellia bacterium]